MNYIDFLKSKQISCDSSGFDCSEFNPMLFDWQKDVTRWGLKKGKVAYFEECGLGKTIQQLEFAEQVHIHTDLPVLILAPLAVARQTTDCEGRKFGYAEILSVNGNVKTINRRKHENIKNHYPSAVRYF